MGRLRPTTVREHVKIGWVVALLVSARAHGALGGDSRSRVGMQKRVEQSLQFSVNRPYLIYSSLRSPEQGRTGTVQIEHTLLLSRLLGQQFVLE
jgi:hypothetical protein